MNWRRGAALAVVNVLIVIGAIAQVEFARRVWIKEMKDRNQILTSQHATEITSHPTGEMSVTFDPCFMTDTTPPAAEPAIFGNVPAAEVVGWGEPCPSNWSIAGRLGAHALWWPRADVSLERRIDLCMLLLVGVQWLVLGAVPTLAHRSWWREPGALITVCTAVGVALVTIPWTQPLGRLAAAVAALTWLVWLALAAVALIRKLWFRRRTSSISA